MWASCSHSVVKCRMKNTANSFWTCASSVTSPHLCSLKPLSKDPTLCRHKHQLPPRSVLIPQVSICWNHFLFLLSEMFLWKWRGLEEKPFALTTTSNGDGVDLSFSFFFLVAVPRSLQDLSSPGIKLVPPTLEQSLNHWATREVPGWPCLKCFPPSLYWIHPAWLLNLCWTSFLKSVLRSLSFNFYQKVISQWEIVFSEFVWRTESITVRNSGGLVFGVKSFGVQQIWVQIFTVYVL